MTKSLDEKIKKFAVKHNYSRRIGGAETHWYFIEAEEAFRQGLFIASTLCFLNGIESSIRAVLMYQTGGWDSTDLTGKVLSNSLLRAAKEVGFNVGLLALQDEDDFFEKLNSNKTSVELVRLRNNLCHGNVFEHIREDNDTEGRIFNPEFLSPIADEVRNIGEIWSKEIERFKLLNYIDNN